MASEESIVSQLPSTPASLLKNEFFQCGTGYKPIPHFANIRVAPRLLRSPVKANGRRLNAQRLHAPIQPTPRDSQELSSLCPLTGSPGKRGKNLAPLNREQDIIE